VVYFPVGETSHSKLGQRLCHLGEAHVTCERVSAPVVRCLAPAPQMGGLSASQISPPERDKHRSRHLRVHQSTSRARLGRYLYRHILYRKPHNL